MLRTGFSFLGPLSQGDLLALLYVLLGRWVVKEGPRVALGMWMEFGYVGWDVVSWRPYKARAETGAGEKWSQVTGSFVHSSKPAQKLGVVL